MAFNDGYLKRTELVIDVMNIIDWGHPFALKGGTAINLFHTNMPRISVDLDLVYLPINNNINRTETITEINKAMKIIADKIIKSGYNAEITETEEYKYQKILVSNDQNVIIIIEPNYLNRGTVLPPVKLSLVEKAVEIYKKDASVLCLDYKEVYAGKMMAFVERQHPRDIFDMAEYYKKEKTLAPLMDTFMVYVIQGDRPFSELLNPNLKDISNQNNLIVGMTNKPVDIQSLIDTRSVVIKNMKENITEKHKEFLISVMNKTPDWSKLPYGDLSHLPGIGWKLINIDKMSDYKLKNEIEKIQSLGISKSRDNSFGVGF